MRSIVSVTTRGALAQMGGLSVWERLVRTLRVVGSEAVTILVGPDIDWPEFESSARDRSFLELAFRYPNSSDIEGEGHRDRIPADSAQLVLLASGEHIYDRRILELLLGLSYPTAVVDSDPPGEWEALVEGVPAHDAGRVCGLAVVPESEVGRSSVLRLDEVAYRLIQQSYRITDVNDISVRAPNLRRDLRPFWFPAPSRRNRPIARSLLHSASQKGALDVPAYVHAPIEDIFAWKLSSTRITPNQLTVVTTGIAWVATLFFSQGRLGFATVLALLVGVLDGVDGKLARLRFEFSRFGRIEHLLDFVYEWSWWIALAYYFSRSGLIPHAWMTIGFLAFFEFLDGVAKFVSIRSFDRLIDEMSQFERIVRLVGGRRNIYVWLLAIGVLLGRPEVAFQALPVWQGVTTLLHWLRLPWLLVRDKRRNAIGGGPA